MLKIKLRPETFQLFALQLGDLLSLGQRFRHGFSGHLSKGRLVVERLEMGWATRLVQIDDPLGFSGVVKRIDYSAPAVALFRPEQLWIQQRTQRERSQARGRTAQKSPAVQVKWIKRIHLAASNGFVQIE